MHSFRKSQQRNDNSILRNQNIKTSRMHIVLILDDNSEYLALAKRKIGLFGEN